MKKTICVLFSIVFFGFFISAGSEDKVLFSGTAEEVLGISEEEMMEKAIDALLDEWKNGTFLSFNDRGAACGSTGFLQILHAQICYIDQEYASSETVLIQEKEQKNDVYGVFCVIEFNVITDIYGTSPFYTDLGTSDVIIYRDGSIKTERFSSFTDRYILRYRFLEFGKMFASVKQTDDYNHIYYHLVDE